VTFDQLVTFMREFGFPVVVAMWFMLRLEKRLDRQQELLSSLMTSTAILARSLDDHRADIRARSGLVPVVTLPEEAKS